LPIGDIPVGDLRHALLVDGDPWDNRAASADRIRRPATGQHLWSLA
jgi:hypothetical protein